MPYPQCSSMNAIKGKRCTKIRLWNDESVPCSLWTFVTFMLIPFKPWFCLSSITTQNQRMFYETDKLTSLLNLWGKWLRLCCTPPPPPPPAKKCAPGQIRLLWHFLYLSPASPVKTSEVYCIPCEVCCVASLCSWPTSGRRCEEFQSLSQRQSREHLVVAGYQTDPGTARRTIAGGKKFGSGDTTWILRGGYLSSSQTDARLQGDRRNPVWCMKEILWEIWWTEASVWWVISPSHSISHKLMRWLRLCNIRIYYMGC